VVAWEGGRRKNALRAAIAESPQVSLAGVDNLDALPKERPAGADPAQCYIAMFPAIDIGKKPWPSSGEWSKRGVGVHVGKDGGREVIKRALLQVLTKEASDLSDAKLCAVPPDCAFVGVGGRSAHDTKSRYRPVMPGTGR